MPHVTLGRTAKRAGEFGYGRHVDVEALVGVEEVGVGQDQEIIVVAPLEHVLMRRYGKRLAASA